MQMLQAHGLLFGCSFGGRIRWMRVLQSWFGRMQPGCAFENAQAVGRVRGRATPCCCRLLPYPSRTCVARSRWRLAGRCSALLCSALPSLPCPPSAPADITFSLPHHRTLLLSPTRCPAPRPSTAPPPPSSLRTNLGELLSRLTSLVNGSSSRSHAGTALAAPTRLRVTRKLVSLIRVTARA